MMGLALVLLIIVAVVILVLLATSLRVVQQYERGIVFRLGRVQPGVREPGLTVIVPFIDRLQKVNMQIIAMGVPAQDGITKDNVSVRVDAVVYFRVIDPIKAIVNVQNYLFAVSQVAQTSLRSVIGRSDLDQLLSERDLINAELRRIIDEPTEGPWGIRIERVEIKDVSLPEGMKRSMSRQAEAERERRARIIAADGEYQASKRLAAAAHVMANDPASLQLRLLQTVVEVAAEKNSTLVMPLPVEIMRFFEKIAPAPKQEPVGDVDRDTEPPAPDEEEAPAIEPVVIPPDTGLAERPVQSPVGRPVASPGSQDPTGSPQQPGFRPPQGPASADR